MTGPERLDVEGILAEHQPADVVDEDDLEARAACWSRGRAARCGPQTGSASCARWERRATETIAPTDAGDKERQMDAHV